ncbi:MmpS family transport accessory protein [Nucisporomicrobium flavum]|uniref:MmpS family transport accessory protein n=1 Tax=Nucisporomicrobium flavum TaxID=2785915 RepID=UPI0018F66594|nr:MmpS family transport accessory protein [Nucisporomicrobium flavum]
MKRVLAGVLIGATVLLSSGCGSLDRGEHGEISYEVTGEAGTTADITRVLPVDAGGTPSVTFPAQKLPASMHASIAEGTFEVHAVPAKGAAGCRIVVDGEEADKQTGAPGKEVICRATVKAR